jgi:flagellar hook-basal body complex protein FliE
MIQPISPLPPLAPLNPSPGAATTFGDLLAQAVNRLNQSELQGQAALVGVAAGTVSLEQAVVATAQASLMLDIAAEVRNRVVDAYQQIWSMQL